MTANQKRSGEIKIRINPAERAVIEGKATAMGLPVAVYLRQKGTGDLVEENAKKNNDREATKKPTVKPDILVRMPGKWADYMAKEATQKGFSLSLQIRFCVSDALASMKKPLSAKDLEKVKIKAEELDVKRGGRAKKSEEKYHSVRMFLGPKINDMIRGISEEKGLLISDVIRALLKLWFEKKGIG